MPPSQDCKEICQTVISAWDAQGLRLNPGATESKLKRFESSYGIRLPEDFRYFYSLANGMHSDDCDNLFFWLWPLETIVEKEGVTKRIDDKHRVTVISFGDFLIDSHRYVLLLDEQGGSGVWAESFGKAASNFEEFLFIYINDPEKIYLYDLGPQRRTST